MATSATTDAATKSAIDLTTKGAESFTQLYYTTLDRNRSLVVKLYRPQSRCVWNGIPLPPYADAGFERFFNAGVDKTTGRGVPLVSVHEVGCVDCHPLVSPGGGVTSTAPTAVAGAGAGDDKVDMVVTASGSVKYDNQQHPRGFQQTFVLKRDPDPAGGGNYYIDTDCFRLVVAAS